VKADEPRPVPVAVRPARESDIGALLLVERQCFDVYYYARYQLSREDFQRYLEDTACVFLVAIHAAQPPPATNASQDRAVGYVLGPVDARRPRRIAHIDSIAVLPEVQHRKIGARLLRAFCARARQRGARRLTLEVAVANEIGLAFFAGHGFDRVRRLPHYYGRSLDGLLLSADL
jgi:ribosomal protein S18 acetylase RimI-like enzyme